ncbi:MAG: GGDEF domain-containing protein [Planctomycetota bacterium]
MADAPAPDRSNDAAHANGNAAGGDDARRIVLVGKTGLEAALRGERVVAVRSGVDALGEIARTQAHAGGRVVVIGEAIDVDPLVPRAGRLVEALRRLDRGVSVFAVGRPLTDKGALADAYDGWLDADDPEHAARMVRRPRSGRPTRTPPAPPHRPATHAAPTQQSPALQQQPPQPAAPRDDAALVGRLLAGQPLLEAALAIAARRLGGAKLELLEAPRPGVATAQVRAPDDGERFGVLAAPPAAADGLPDIAGWLGLWLSLERRQRALQHEATTDPLTGALNRRAFERVLGDALDRARDERRDVSVLLFDIDNFKRYNDEHGHAAGDEILVEAVRLIASVIRPSDTVCRIGGDEFAVIFDDPEGPREPSSHHPTSVLDLAHRFQAQIAAQRFPKLGDDAPGSLTISGGLATFPWDGLDADDLVRVADARAMDSKRQGKNAITVGPAAEPERD